VQSDDVKTVFYLALGAGAVYLAWKAYQTVAGAASAAATAASAAQDTAASSVADAAQAILGTGIAQPGQSYTVTMPDGSVQTVPYGKMPTPLPSQLNGLGAMRRPGIRRYRVRQ